MRIAYRTTMPFNNRDEKGNPSLSPSTERGIMPFNNVFTIQDVLDGKKYDSLHGGGSWSSGEDTTTSYRENADDYKRLERDMEIMQKMTTTPTQPPQKWKVKVPGGTIVFPSFDLASQYIRKNNIPFKYISRLAQIEKSPSTSRINIISDALEKCFMVESICATKGVKETGSAFCIAPNLFLTCAHVIKRYSLKDMEQNVDLREGAIIHLIHNGEWKEATLVDYNLQWDIAIIKSDLPSNVMELDLSPIMVGETIVCIGSPHGFENNVSIGTMGAIDKKVLTHEGAPKYMFLDVSVFPGNSGGPIIRETNGKVIGMVSMVVSSGGEEYGLDAGLPATYVESFCKKFLPQGA